MRVRLVLCLPTYNEIQNLEPMVRALGEIFAREALDGRVLVIDDASPDGTGELADRLSAELQYVDVLHRVAKQGLGPAYVAGFRRALAEGAELIMEMDCDFSHDPRRRAATRPGGEPSRPRARFTLRPRRAGGELGSSAAVW